MTVRCIAQLSVLMVLLAACTTAVTPTPSPDLTPVDLPPVVGPTLVPTFTPLLPTRIPSPVPTLAPRTLTICIGEEPRTLSLYGESANGRGLILEAIYDGPIDVRSFDYQPVILEKLPSLADGDAVLEPVAVRDGDRVVDNNGQVIELANGAIVRPAGCQQDSCRVVYDGGWIRMDQLSATFRLLPGITWSDGMPLTAYDSVLSFRLAQQTWTDWQESKGQSGPRPDRKVDLAPHTASYIALDEQTVRWVGLPGWLDPAYQANFFTPLPGHRLSGLSLEDEGAQLPLGWGPYILKQWIPGDRIIAERNPNYFRADEGLPYFDRVVFRFVGQDTARNLADLRDGWCDLLTLDTNIDSQTDLQWQFLAAGALKTRARYGSVWEHLDFGINPASDYDRSSYFKDVRMRRAVAQCIDRQQLIDEVYLGRAVMMNSYVPPNHPLYLGSGLPEYEFDPVAGSSMLEQLGWQDADGDGVREAHRVAGIPDGAQLELYYQAPTSGARTQIAELIAADLAACGISTTVTLEPAAEFFASGPEGSLYGRRFDLAQFSWLMVRIPPCGLFVSSEIPAADSLWSGDNVTGYSSPEYDAACQAALTALPGTADYEKYHLQALQLFAEELPVLPLMMRVYVYGVRPELIGIGLDPTDAPETWNIEEWRLEP